MLYFSPMEQKAFLEKHGCVVKERKVRMAYPDCHDSMGYRTLTVWTVHRNGKALRKPTGCDFRECEWLEDAFNQVLKEVLLKL